MWKQLRSYLNINALFNCPLAVKKLPFEEATCKYIIADYQLFFGWGFDNTRQMNMIGDRLEYNGSEFDVLAADLYAFRSNKDTQYSAHKDGKNVITSYREQDLSTSTGSILTSIWKRETATPHGTIPRNFLRTDGSVYKEQMAYLDSDFKKVPVRAGSGTIYYNLLQPRD